jgi:phage-related protein
MPKELTPHQKKSVNQLEAEWPNFWLYEIEVPTDPPTRYRLTNNTRAVQFGTNSLGEPITYFPLPIFHGGIKSASNGNLPSIDVSVGNVSREISAALAAYGGLVGAPCVIRLVNAGELLNSAAQYREDSIVRGVRVTQEVVTFTLAAGNLYERQLPARRITSGHCGFQYGGAACGHDIELTGLLTCSKLKDGANGCTEHGDAELAEGAPRLHPERFGAFPGVKSTKAVG